MARTFCLLLVPPAFNWCFSFAPELVSYLAHMDLHRRAANTETVSPRFLFIMVVINIYLFVLDDSLTS